MAVEIPVFEDSFVAGADLSAKQYYAVKLNGSLTDGIPQVVVCAATTDKPIGILQNNPTSGKVAEVMLIGRSKVNSDAALAVDDSIGTSADGQLAPYVAGTDTTKYIMGRVIEASSAAGEYASAYINTMTMTRGA